MDREAEAEISHMADEFKLLYRKDRISATIEETKIQIEEMRANPAARPEEIEAYEQYLQANIMMLKRLDQVEADMYDELNGST